MTLLRVPAIAAVAILAAGPVCAQCHVDQQRREDALAAVRLIDRALTRVGPAIETPYPGWEELARAAVVPTLRGMGGPMGDVARRMNWGGSEPLPGWVLHYVVSADAYAFSLTDTLDPCGVTYSSSEKGVVLEGHPVRGRRFGVVPVT